jgi:hypothetical protein
MRLLAFAVLLLAAGCGSAPVWTHPTKDMADYKKDLADCERFFSGSERETLGCMTRRGWHKGK